MNSTDPRYDFPDEEMFDITEQEYSAEDEYNPDFDEDYGKEAA